MEEQEIDQEFYTKFSSELKTVEKKIAGEIDPGMRGLVVGVAVIAAFLSLLLIHAGHTRGVDILTNSSSTRVDGIGLPSRLFTWIFLIFDIGFSILALLTRRWIFAWITAAGCFIAIVYGVLSIWLRQTPGVSSINPPHAGLGLWLQLSIAIFLAFHWIRIVGIRTNYHLALEAERRDVAKLQAASTNIAIVNKISSKTQPH